MEQVSDQQPAGAFYVDEEDCLGFKIFLAELELLVGSSRGKNRPDAGKALKLLQKLVVTLDRTERPEIKEYQRRCEHAVIDILLKGAPPPVSCDYCVDIQSEINTSHRYTCFYQKFKTKITWKRINQCIFLIKKYRRCVG